MLSTYASYQMISRDIEKSIDRVEQQPTVERDTEYYLKNIVKVKSIDDLMADDRLYRYAMKSHGLEDMTYAKAFMVKAMKEGISDPNSFANKLTDKRYAEFVATFNFAARGEQATVFNPAQQATAKNYAAQAAIFGVDPKSEAVVKETAYYLANIVKVTSIDELLDDNRLYSYAMKAYGLGSMIADKETVRDILEGGVRDPKSIASTSKDNRIKALAASFNFEALGEAATTYNAAQEPAVEKYLRQTLEENAGAENEGVRLALYFERKAAKITSYYDVLADRALAQVVRTALGMPQSLATADIDRQVKMFEAKLDIEDLKDPEKLGKFMTRFTSMWELDNPTSSEQTSLGILFGQPVEYGISTNLLLTMQAMKR